jgi:hypothetical protein
MELTGNFALREAIGVGPGRRRHDNAGTRAGDRLDVLAKMRAARRRRSKRTKRRRQCE